MHGDQDQINSTRGELFGILGCMRHIDYILAKYKMKLKKKIPIYTDSKSSIQIAETPLYLSYKNAFYNDADIKAEMRSMFEKLKGVITLHHVKAHHDKKIVLKNLSTAVNLNSKMDLFAKDALINTPKIKARRMVSHLPKQKNVLKQNLTESHPMLLVTLTDIKLDMNVNAGSVLDGSSHQTKCVTLNGLLLKGSLERLKASN